MPIGNNASFAILYDVHWEKMPDDVSWYLICRDWMFFCKMYNTDSGFIFIPPGSCLRILFYLPGYITRISDVTSHMRSRLRCFQNFAQGLISGIKYIFLGREKAGAGIAHGLLHLNQGSVKLNTCRTIENEMSPCTCRVAGVTIRELSQRNIASCWYQYDKKQILARVATIPLEGFEICLEWLASRAHEFTRSIILSSFFAAILDIGSQLSVAITIVIDSIVVFISCGAFVNKQQRFDTHTVI